ncbi:MAG: TIGR04282 family arsenosugar biosynthesis glycosyltransferase [Desulfobacteraceae bacterium]|nr:TIGR04282 family arsenosugar biosynthesis glycosyltransferase [Desulfobacteraceae bacterium]
MNRNAQDRRVLVFLRSPRQGRVKTRLARHLGPKLTLALYRCFVEDLLGTLAAIGVPTTVCFFPQRDEERVRSWLGSNHGFQPQQGGHLGERMAGAFQQAFDADRRLQRAVLVGTDVPDLPGGVIQEAFKALCTTDAVLGPAYDGGYYLVGFQRSGFCPGVFQDVAWGTPTVLGDSLAALDDAGCRYRLLRRWRDVDNRGDLLRLRETILSDPDTPARDTALLLASREVSLLLEK